MLGSRQQDAGPAPYLSTPCCAPSMPKGWGQPPLDPPGPASHRGSVPPHPPPPGQGTGRAARTLVSSIPSPLLGLQWFSGAAVTKHHRLGGLRNRNGFSPGSGGWKSKIKVPAGWVLRLDKDCSRPSSSACRQPSYPCISSLTFPLCTPGSGPSPATSAHSNGLI